MDLFSVCKTVERHIILYGRSTFYFYDLRVNLLKIEGTTLIYLFGMFYFLFGDMSNERT